MSAVSGTVSVDGRPVGGQDVLVLADGRLVTSATSDDRGAFSVDADGAVVLLAKLRGGTFGIVSRAVAPGQRADLALDGPLGTVALELAGHDLPEQLDLTLEPVTLAGVDDALIPFAKLQPGGTIAPHFGHRVIDTRGAELRLQPGTWRLTARWEDPDRTHLPSFSGDAVVEVTPDGEQHVRLDVRS